MQSVVVRVDASVGNEDDDVGKEVVVGKNLEDRRTSDDLEGSCWTNRLS
jgi:hypothetical protein